MSVTIFSKSSIMITLSFNNMLPTDNEFSDKSSGFLMSPHFIRCTPTISSILNATLTLLNSQIITFDPRFPAFLLQRIYFKSINVRISSLHNISPATSGFGSGNVVSVSLGISIISLTLTTFIA